ncbi:MAG: DUF3857 domain-containing protein [Lutibacter sp.]|uniref:transglutaminase domain-containing protein n=1 Tax=Lutibacter sp. TaxID=1925666 RepID=UPI0019EC10E0|nr:DUF3857 domain-containing protein [Lutibacter sp.]NOR29373.1 DUF3857 domain-containing protein [Lutibacter sp.]
MKKILITMVLIFMANQLIAQNHKFGKVSKEELQEEFYPQDSSANAAYLYKKRRSYTVVLAGQIKIITEIHVRLKIYNQEGFDWTTENISLYGTLNSNRERFSNLKAVTYNLIDGDIVTTKLDKNNIFSEEKSKSWTAKKFTMPNVKKGSVLEWTYKIYSPYFYNIDDIIVQYKIPVKRYETKLELLEWFQFSKRHKGYYPFRIEESTKINHDFNTNDKIIKIVENNVPALKNEPYVNNIYNYAAGLQLEVASLSAPTLGLYENYTTSWKEVAKDIMMNSSFEGELKKISHLKDDISILKSELTNFSTKVVGALEYVKSKIKWNGNYDKYTENGLRKAYSEGVGNCADINLTLVAVLRELGLNANPVLVSTRSNGIPIFPTNRGFNYVIAVVETDEGKIVLDASEKYSLPNILPLRAMNWNGTIVRGDKTIGFVKLSSSKVSRKIARLNYKITEDGIVEGVNRITYENYSSLAYRNKNGNLKEEIIISNIEQLNNDLEVLNFRVSNLNSVSKPVVEMYKFEIEDGAEVIGNHIYIKPMLFLSNNESPFKLDTRKYPIDFGFPWEEKVTVGIQIPEGYVIESIPESLAIGLRDNVGVYKFSIVNNGNSVQLISTLKMNEGIVPAYYYSEIKEFYKMIVTKNLEQIVLKKSE